ncbi:DUF3037 domain-containing protein [Chryseobacterium sp. T1]
MQELKLYEYAVIRLVPKPEREEFLNVGLILFSKREKLIKAKTFLSAEKLACYSCETELDDIINHLTSFENVANGDKKSSPIALMDIPERFRWLTAVRSSIIQTSRPHPGMTKDLETTFDTLFTELVL